ncbi:hypothetical protein [Pontibacter sp. G13]|uniref:hypothetical protein n=1 Tax=Pontibacter sp. G13 TaxID=3074898 RepID=UPI00288A89F3|nr:hypothetical protein [Pontibacter sp. G13]WNJ18192.1 hypothetical protein RJD25_25355 [Pontibacter sp. G13]
MSSKDFPTLLGCIETHDVEGIRSCFQNGISPNENWQGVSLFHWMIRMYARSPRFSACMEAFWDAGLTVDDADIMAVLLNRAEEVRERVQAHPELLARKWSFPFAYTPLTSVSLLHLCAEFNLLETGQVLLESGANVDEPAGINVMGFGGQTPIFHTVCQNLNQSEPMMELLLKHGADLSVTVRGFVWGEGEPWETFIPAVNPISYAAMGLLPQFHRDPVTISNIVSRLLKHQYGIDYQLPNILNRYLQKQ